MSLVRFLLLAEEVGDAPQHAHALVGRLGASTVDGLITAGLLEPAGARDEYHCGAGFRDGCARRVVELPGESDLPMVASCGRSPQACAAIRLARSDTHTFRIRLSEVEAALVSLLKLTGARAMAANNVVKLGDQPRQKRRPREVFLAWRPGDPEFATFLASRRGMGLTTLVLVPTTAAVPSEIVLVHARGRRVQMGVISELFVLRNGGLARTRRAPPLRSPPKKRRTLLEKLALEKAVLPAVSDWNEAAFRRPDDGRLLLRVGAHEIAVNHVDLGMAKPDGTPTQSYDLLLATCDAHGWFPRTNNSVVDKVRLVRLRKALRKALGLSGDPFYRYKRRVGWRARFGASCDLARARPVHA